MKYFSATPINKPDRTKIFPGWTEIFPITTEASLCFLDMLCSCLAGDGYIVKPVDATAEQCRYIPNIVLFRDSSPQFFTVAPIYDPNNHYTAPATLEHLLNALDMLNDCEPDEGYILKIVEMTPRQYRRLPEFTGF